MIMEMPNLDQIVKTVCYGIELVDKSMDPNDAARFVNKTNPCGLVDDYVREYIIKSITGRDTGEVMLDSAGERKGRVQKVIERVADEMSFTCPKFVFRYAEKDEPSQLEEDPKPDEERTIELLIDIVNMVKNIEQKLNRAEVKIIAPTDGLTDWHNLHVECRESNKEAEMA